MGLAKNIKGYIVICAEGQFTERFLNICMHRKIFLWDIRRGGSDRLYASVRISDFPKLRQIARKTRTKVRIFARCGLPFFLNRYRKRKLSCIGVFLFAAVVWYFSSHVMGIDVKGNELIPTETVLKNLSEAGVYRGAPIRDINYHEVQNAMMRKVDGLSWIGINLKGSRISVEVRERIKNNLQSDFSVPCNLIAAKNGIITRTEIREGQTIIKIGELAEKGDLLVSGAIDSQSQGIRYTHSFGEVYAKTVYRETKEYSLVFSEKVFTGLKTKRFSLNINGTRLKLYFGDNPPYKFSDKKLEQKGVSSAKVPIPALSLECETYFEYQPKQRTRTTDDAVALGKEELDKMLCEKIPKSAKIEEKNITYRLTDTGKIAVTAEYICTENIAVEAPLDIDIRQTSS